jgi:hypothetical protein
MHGRQYSEVERVGTLDSAESGTAKVRVHHRYREPDEVKIGALVELHLPGGDYIWTADESETVGQMLLAAAESARSEHH